MSASLFSPAWSRFFGLAPESAPAAPGRQDALSPRQFFQPATGTAWARPRPTFASTEAGATGEAAASSAAVSGGDGRGVWPASSTAPSGATQATGRQDAGAAKPAPRWQAKELRWLAAFLPEQQQNDLVFCLGETLGWRARQCEPLQPPKEAIGQARFGLVGEQLWGADSDDLRERLRAELREAIRTLEGEQPRLVRNALLAMRAVRLGQLYRELLRRRSAALEEARSGLSVLWA